MPQSKVAENQKKAALPLLFSPIKIRNVEIKNRVAWAPMGVSFTVEGATKFSPGLSQRYIDFNLARAKGGVGLILLSGAGFARMEVAMSPENTVISIKEFKKMNDQIHQAGAKIGIQLSHSGRQVDAPQAGYIPVAPSSIFCSATKCQPKEMTIADIEEIIERHVQGGVNCWKAGFDVVEVKACHGYLLSSVLSPTTNRRTDKYGGSTVNRARMIVEIIKGIKQRCPEILISTRFNGADNFSEEGVPGLTLEDTMELAKMFEDAGSDVLHVSAGMYGAYPVIIPPFHVRNNCYMPYAAGIKKSVKIPVIGVGRVTDPRQAEEALQAGQCDIVAFGRALWADADLPVKGFLGQYDDIRKCVSCNQGCQDRTRPLDSTCLVNPAMGRETATTITKAAKPKKVIVVGAGVSGMEAALIAAQRGHNVTLYEESDKLGGQWNLAATPPEKSEFNSVKEYLTREMKKAKVKIELGKKVTGAVIEKEKPDAVVVATGATQSVPPIPGVQSPNVVGAWDVLAGKAKVGDKVMVMGGSGTGMETAHFLAAQGKKVTVVEMLQYFGPDLGATVRWHTRHKLDDYGVKMMRSTKVKSINNGIVTAEQEGKEVNLGPFDTIVMACGSKSRNELAEEVKGKVAEVYVVGDAVKPRNGLWAIREGFEAGLKV